MRARRGTLGVAAWLIAAGAAQAQPIAIAWNAPAECGSAEALASAVEALLGPAWQPAPHAPAPSGSATVRLNPNGWWALELVTRRGDEEGSRVLEGESCSAVLDAAALILALMIDPHALEREPPPPPAVLPEPAPAPAPAPTTHRPSAPRPRALRVHVELGGAGVLGPLPSLAPGVTATLGYDTGVGEARATFDYYPPVETRVGDHASAAATLTMLEARAHFCPAHLTSGAMQAAACGGVAAGRTHGEGRGVTSPASATSLWVGPSLALILRARLTEHAGLVLDAGASAPLERPRFVIGGVGTAHRSWVVGARASLGGEVLF